MKIPFHSTFPDEIIDGAQKLPELKPDPNKANPRLGIGALAFSADSRYMFTRNGEWPLKGVISGV